MWIAAILTRAQFALAHTRSALANWALCVSERFQLALDRADYFVFCDDQAAHHYGECPSKLWSARVWCRGFINGLQIDYPTVALPECPEAPGYLPGSKYDFMVSDFFGVNKLLDQAA